MSEENLNKSFKPEEIVSQQKVLHILLEHSTDVMLILDRNFTIIAANKKAAEMSQTLIPKVVRAGESLFDLIFPERAQLLKGIQEKVLSGETVEYIYSKPELDEAVILLRYIPVRNEKKEIDLILMSGINITREQHAIKLSQASRELMQKAESIASIGSWEWDIATDQCIFSDEFYRLCGLEPGEIEASRENGLNVLHPGDRQLAIQILNHSFSSGLPYDIMLRVVTKRGDIKFVQCQGIVTRNVKGRAEKFVGTFHDITALKKLEASIESTQQKYKYLVEHSADMMLQINHSREIIFASPSVLQVLGYSPLQLMGKKLGELAAEEDLPFLLENYKSILENPLKPVTLEYRVQKKNGDLVWVEGTITNLFNVENIASVVINQREITHRKEAESILKNLNIHLAAQANELKRSNGELERFAYIASHDLQQPLRMVQSFLELLQKRYQAHLDEKANEFIDFAVDGAAHMKKLINGLLEYSRQGNPDMKRELINMNEQLVNIKNLFQKNNQEAGASIEVGALPEIIANKVQVGQLFQNLVGNALKYNSNTKPVIKISAEKETAGWKFIVADNGIGIQEEDRQRIFNIFQRLNHHDKYEGSGIGLSISKKIVEAHGGKIWVEDNGGQGSRFCFTIKEY
ncbi:MAG: PAS domain S-box protein [Ferruginibacter sp.]